MTDMTDTLLRQYPVLTLTPADSNEKIRRTAFDFVHDVGYMVFASTALDGKTPTARGLGIIICIWALQRASPAIWSGGNIHILPVLSSGIPFGGCLSACASARI